MEYLQKPIWIRSLRKYQQITKTTSLYAHNAGKLKPIVPPNYLETRKQTNTKIPSLSTYTPICTCMHTHTHTSNSFLGERNLNGNKNYL